MKRLLIICFFFPTLLFAGGGIEWAKPASFAKLIEQARNEKKMIFFDIFATWCGPCKEMDRTVYTDSSAGTFFNDKFISVKVQMDQTANDDPAVKAWYDDAKRIGRQYRIEGYPSFLFFDSEGNLVYKEMGMMNAPKLVELAQTALKDPFKYYDQQVARLKGGDTAGVDLKALLYMAKRKGDAENTPFLLSKYVLYLKSGGGIKDREKAEISLLTGFMEPRSGSPAFDFFCKNQKEIDRVSGTGCTRYEIDKCIKNSIVTPWLAGQPNKSKTSMGGMKISGGKESPPDFSEANWNQLNEVLTKYIVDKAIVNRNISAAKAEWYKRLGNYNAYFQVAIEGLRKYPHDLSEKNVWATSEMNLITWDAFIRVTDKKILQAAVEFASAPLKSYPGHWDSWDTYAGLVYKLYLLHHTESLEKAIECEQRAIKVVEAESTKPINPDILKMFPNAKDDLVKQRTDRIQGYEKIIEQMKKGEIIYINEPGSDWVL